MKLQRFEVESYMTLHENNCRYNLADTVAKSLTLKELLAYDKKDSLEDLMNLSLDYGAIEGSHELKISTQINKTSPGKNIIQGATCINCLLS